jgi:ABC-type branched-subunit amino acid transport system substrate-binding protein
MERRSGLGLFAAMLVVLALAACQSPFGASGPSAPAVPRTTGELIGNGSVRVALLLPRSASGNGGMTATAFRNAAELAIRDFPNAGIQLAVYDTAGTPAGAQAAIGAALREGAEIVLGPVFSTSVSAIAPAARQANVPVVAFSSDASVAGAGIYLLSFLPADDVERIVSYSTQQGRKSFAALLPANAYGSVTEAAFRSAVARAGGRIVAIERYDPAGSDIDARVKSFAAFAPQVDALFVPDNAAVGQIAALLATAGIDRARLKLLGSGLWDDPQVLANPALTGSWFPGPSKEGFDSFARRYQGAYGTVPPRNATLAYDATVLAAGLVRQFGAERFQTSVLTNANGFAGLDGVFRFHPTGLTERRLAVYEITGSGATIVAPAGRSFTGS